MGKIHEQFTKKISNGSNIHPHMGIYENNIFNIYMAIMYSVHL